MYIRVIFPYFLLRTINLLGSMIGMYQGSGLRIGEATKKIQIPASYALEPHPETVISYPWMSKGASRSEPLPGEFRAFGFRVLFAGLKLP